MTKRDQGNFFAGRAASMVGLSVAKTMSGFGAYQSNGNKTGFLFKLKAGINMLDQLFMNFGASGTPAGTPVVRPIFPDDQVSEDLQRAGYNQFSR